MPCFFRLARDVRCAGADAGTADVSKRGCFVDVRYLPAVLNTVDGLLVPAVAAPGHLLGERGLPHVMAGAELAEPDAEEP